VVTGSWKRLELRRGKTYFGPERDSPVIRGPGWISGRPGGILPRDGRSVRNRGAACSSRWSPNATNKARSS